MILISALTSTFFFGGWLSPFEGYPCLGRHRLAGGAGAALVRAQDRVLPVLLPVVPRDVPALPLRPDHASRLEGVHSRDAGVARVEAALWYQRIGPWAA